MSVRTSGSDPAKIMVVGTGAFASRIVCDIAATASPGLEVRVVGRAPASLDWIRTAARSRAAIFGRSLRISTRVSDLGAQSLVDEIADFKPDVIVQAASAQGAAVIGEANSQWAQLVARGGLSASGVIQAHVSSRVSAALRTSGLESCFINCCFPDVVNEIIRAQGLPVTCGLGNVAILANAFRGEIEGEADVKVLAHYQTIGAWRMPASSRSGRQARVWIDGVELPSAFDAFPGVKLSPQPVIDISGAAGVPLIDALARGSEWNGHAPGPSGLPGGYPISVANRKVELDLPKDIAVEDAVAWNRSFEEESGLVVTADGRIRYTGLLYELIRKVSPDLAEGFHVSQIDDAFAAMIALRGRLSQSSNTLS